MNEQAAIDAIKNLIFINAAELVEGIFVQGKQAEVKTVTSTVLTPPTGYYHVAINVPSVQSQSRTGLGDTQVARPPRQDTYQVQVWLTASGTIEQGEENPYERAHNNFRVFSDRVYTTVERQAPNDSDPTVWLRDPRTDLMFQIARQSGQDRMITKQNEIAYNEDQPFVLGLVSIISFRLTQNCGTDLNSSKLFPGNTG